MKFGEVFDYRTAEEAKKYLGKKGAFSDCLLFIEKMPKQCELLILKEIAEKSTHPFTDGRGGLSQFFRPVLEEEELMTNRQLAEWVARGNGEYSFGQSSTAFCSWDYSRLNEHDSVSVTTLIRRWNDTEWVKPTKAIYEEDCMPNTAINKEDCQ